MEDLQDDALSIAERAAFAEAKMFVQSGFPVKKACRMAAINVEHELYRMGRASDYDFEAWAIARGLEKYRGTLSFKTKYGWLLAKLIEERLFNSARGDEFLDMLGVPMEDYADKYGLNPAHVRRLIEVRDTDYHAGKAVTVSWKLAMPDGVRFGVYPGCIEFYRVDCDLQEFPGEACDPDLPYGTVDRYLVAWAVDDAYAWGLEHGTKRFGECLVGSEYADPDEECAETTYRNLKKYAETHGYDFQYENQS